MTTRHKPLEFVAGDTWQIKGFLTASNGAPLDLAGVTIEWRLDDIGRETNRITVAGAVINAATGLCLITVPAEQTEALEAGEYTDQLRVTDGAGGISTQWDGRVLVTLPLG